MPLFSLRSGRYIYSTLSLATSLIRLLIDNSGNLGTVTMRISWLKRACKSSKQNKTYFFLATEDVSQVVYGAFLERGEVVLA